MNSTPAPTPPATIHNLPDGLTLADLHLDGIKVGDEIVSISRAPNGGLQVVSRVFRVSAIENWRVIIRNEDGKTHGAWQTKNSGGCAYAMHPQHVMRYYYSANPEHIARTRRQIRTEKEKAEAMKAAFDAQMVIARPIGATLGDGWESGSNGGDDFYSERAALELASRLTPDQMRTLAGWLGVKLEG